MVDKHVHYLYVACGCANMQSIETILCDIFQWKVRLEKHFDDVTKAFQDS